MSIYDLPAPSTVQIVLMLAAAACVVFGAFYAQRLSVRYKANPNVSLLITMLSWPVVSLWLASLSLSLYLRMWL